MTRGGATPEPTPIDPLEGIYYGSSLSSLTQWPSEGNVSHNGLITIALDKTKYPDKNRVGISQDGASPTSVFQENDDYFYKNMVFEPGTSKVLTLYVDGELVGGSITVTNS